MDNVKTYKYSYMYKGHNVKIVKNNEEYFVSMSDLFDFDLRDGKLDEVMDYVELLIDLVHLPSKS